jgi:hypothetical protein
MGLGPKIGYVIATVKLPLHEGDNYDRDGFWPWFMWEEPAIVDGQMGVSRRECETVEARVELLEESPVAGK